MREKITILENKKWDRKEVWRVKKRRIWKQTEELLEPIVAEQGFELVDVEYVKEAGNWYLRAYIDKPGGITVDDCEVVSRRFQTFWMRKTTSKIPIFWGELSRAWKTFEERKDLSEAWDRKWRSVRTVRLTDRKNLLEFWKNLIRTQWRSHMKMTVHRHLKKVKLHLSV